jgi:hypothetical protein
MVEPEPQRSHLGGAVAGALAHVPCAHAQARDHFAVAEPEGRNRSHSVFYRIATPQGSFPTVMSEVRRLDAVSITDTVPERPLAT